MNNSPIPKELCESHEELGKYGFYRKLNNGKLEFVSFCDQEAARWVAMFEDDFYSLLNQYVPKTN